MVRVVRKDDVLKFIRSIHFFQPYVYIQQCSCVLRSWWNHVICSCLLATLLTKVRNSLKVLDLLSITIRIKVNNHPQISIGSSLRV